MIRGRFGRFAAVAGLVCLVVLTLGREAVAQNYPVKPVRVIVPNTPGGVTDVIARLFAARLSEMWSQAVIVENRPGADQIIGSDVVAKASPDGYTLLVSADSAFVATPHLFGKLPFDPLNDFTSIVGLCQVSPVMSVNPLLAVHDIRELISLAKAKPGALSYGSFGNGTYAHVAMEEFKQLTGTDLLHVPYKGAAPGITDLVSGRISVMLTSLTSVDGLAKAGKLRIIAAAGPKRLALRPELPTVAESGVPGFETGAWFALFGPANLPRPIVKKIYEDATRVVGMPETRQFYTKRALEPVEKTPEQLEQFIRKEFERWGKIIKSIGATAG